MKYRRNICYIRSLKQTNITSTKMWTFNQIVYAVVPFVLLPLSSLALGSAFNFTFWLVFVIQLNTINNYGVPSCSSETLFAQHTDFCKEESLRLTQDTIWGFIIRYICFPMTEACLIAFITCLPFHKNKSDEQLSQEVRDAQDFLKRHLYDNKWIFRAIVATCFTGLYFLCFSAMSSVEL